MKVSKIGTILSPIFPFFSFSNYLFSPNYLFFPLHPTPET